MKRKTLHLSAFLIIPLVILAFLILLSKSFFFQVDSPELWIAISLDLIFTVPIVYFLIIRNSEIPNFTAFSLFVICLILASYIIPLEHQSFLKSFKFFAVPVLEVFILVAIAFKARMLSKKFKEEEIEQDFFDKTKLACQEIVPGRAASLLATEIGVIQYAFLDNKKIKLKENEFTYTKKSGIKSMIWILIFLIIIETFVVHFLLLKWNHTAALIVTFLSVYTCLQIIALLRSLDKRPILIDHENQVLKLRHGFFNQCYIPFDALKSFELSQRSFTKEGAVVKLSALDALDVHNVVLRFTEEQTLFKIYGFEKKVMGLGVFIDDKEAFADTIKDIIPKHS